MGLLKMLEKISTMRISYFANEQTIGQHAGKIILEGLKHKPDLLLCAATGGSPVTTYAYLAQTCAGHPDWFERLRLVKLDEWGGIPKEDPQSCESYLRQHLVEPLGISADRYISFQSNPEVPKLECARIQEALLAQGPIDICVLGLGKNGHIGFNEPDEYLNPHCHVAELTPASMTHAMAEAMLVKPQYGLTLGMADIIAADKIILIIAGKGKRESIEKLLENKVTSALPASFLWLHPNVDCLIDENSL